ncbi:hypothetical protein [Hymenobacter qilianensis]|uniref:hypothetical protein n=1 Tax=Hymenobacter qilianensis TaxID=1385715 RepID=UPI001CB98754|nr:hypothetical protein [Hymenobacter qilianensis]
MSETSRDRMLRRIREALLQPAPQPAAPDFSAPLHPPLTDDLAIHFAQSFARVGGLFITVSPKNTFSISFSSTKKTSS